MVKVADLELKILKVLWKLENKATVNEVLEHWADAKKPGYTTVLKKLQVMEKKGLVGHEKKQKAYVYISLVSKKDVSVSKMTDILNQVFSGNKIALANSMFQDTAFSKDELKKVKEIIEDLEKESSDG